MSAEPSTVNDIDNTDFAILFTVQHHEVPPWKNKVHDWLVDQEENLPITNSVSVQTVGRRIDALVKEDLLETVIVSPDDIKRDLIIAFKLTPEGEEAVEEKREDILRNMVQRQIFDADNGEPIGKGAVITLLLNKFDWDDDLRDSLYDRYGIDELATFLVITYIEEEASSLLGGDQVDQFQDVLSRYDDMADVLVSKADDHKIKA